jgi:hypothetical protein
MEESKLKEIAKAYFEKNPGVKEIFLLKNGLIFRVEPTAIKTAKRLNFSTPQKFVNNTEPEKKAPVSKTTKRGQKSTTRKASIKKSTNDKTK